MKYIKTYENIIFQVDIKTIDPEFWKMIKIANWKKYVYDLKTVWQQGKKGIREKKAWYDAEKRLYSKYDFNQIKHFYNEYQYIYEQLKQYFEKYWLDSKYSSFMPSDDGYSDLISSIIGYGKEFIQKCIDEPQYFHFQLTNWKNSVNFKVIRINLI